jgi:hypothetical protein|tara:strand:+ start:11827 stop:12666 length:840 start_codon:yes stop_codon:yes gene_type:complete
MEIIDTSSLEDTNERGRPLLTQEEYKNIKVMICTPCFGGKMDQATVSGMIGTVVTGISVGLTVDFRFLSNDSLITRARNNLVAQFLASDEHTHLFFLDADIQFNPQSLFRLCLSDRMVSVGAYPTKSSPSRYVVDFKEGATCDEQNFIEVERAGTGFMCIKRECLDKMKTSYPELKYKSELETEGYSQDAKEALGEVAIEKIKENTYSFFDTSIHEIGKNYLSEDYTFCERWKKIGGKIWLDTTSKLDHIGTATYGTSLIDFENVFDGKNKKTAVENNE